MAHTIFPGKLAVSAKTSEAVSNFKPLKTTTNVRSFLSLCSAFRRFVPHFSRVSSPVNKKLTKGSTVRFDEMTDD